MPQVKMPNGVIINFPEGTAPDVINKAAADYWAKNGNTLEAQGRLNSGGVATAALQGIGASFGDEFLGAFGATADALTGQNKGKDWSQRYEINRDQARKDFDQYRQERPWQSFGVTAASGILPAVATGGASTATSLGGRALAGAKTGALWGGISGFGAGKGDITEGDTGRLESAASGAGLGAVLGAGVNTAAPYVVQAVKWLAGRLPSTFTPEGTLTPEAQTALKKMNIDPSQVTSDVMAAVKRDAQGALNPEDLAGNIRMAEARTLPVPVPQTRGMITQDPAQQMFENQARQGGYGTVPQALLKTATGQSQDALRANVPAIQSKLSGTQNPITSHYGDGGTIAATRLQEMATQAKTGVNKAYEAARSMNQAATIPAEQVRNGALLIAQNMAHEGRTFSEAPRVMAAITDMGKSGTITSPNVGDIFKIRSRLSALRQSSDPVESGAASQAVKEFDSWVSNQLDQSFIRGDAEAVSAWRNAIAKRREYGNIFEGNDLVHALTEKTHRGGQHVFSVAPEDAANVIFGRANTPGAPGLGKQNLGRDLLRLKSVLGENSQEWNALREEVFLRFAQVGTQGLRKGEETIFNGSKLSSVWDNANIRHRNVLGVLFTPEERALISQYARVAQRTMSPVEGGTPLGSGMSNIHVLKRLGAMAFAGPRIQALLAMFPGVGKAVAGAAAIPSAYRAVTPKAVSGTEYYPGAARGVASTSSSTRQ